MENQAETAKKVKREKKVSVDHGVSLEILLVEYQV